MKDITVGIYIWDQAHSVFVEGSDSLSKRIKIERSNSIVAPCEELMKSKQNL